MLLPNRERAYIPQSKLTRYLLSLSHPVGKSKALFFHAHGFDAENPDLLEEGLLHIAKVKLEPILGSGGAYQKERWPFVFKSSRPKSRDPE